MSDAARVVGQPEPTKRLIEVVAAVGSVLLGGSLGVAALAEANAAPLAADRIRS